MEEMDGQVLKLADTTAFALDPGSCTWRSRLMVVLAALESFTSSWSRRTPAWAGAVKEVVAEVGAPKVPAGALQV
jgi:hypothetical protein